MIAEIVIGSVCLIVGYIIGSASMTSTIKERLRKRGYYIKNISGYYYSTEKNGYKWVYHGFLNPSKPICVEGPTLPTFEDAVANADAHYYTMIIKDSPNGYTNHI